MKIPFNDLSVTNAPFMEELQAAAARVVASGRYLLGPESMAFESELAARCTVRHAVATSNGLDSIRLILRAWMEIGRLHPGQEVIAPAHTFIASILPIVELGLRPVLVDADPITLNMDLTKAREAVGPDTGAVMLVHLYGRPCWDADFARELRSRGILIIEDDAQAIGAMAAEPGLNGTRATGSLGDAAAISFYPGKNIGALGDAGAVLTSDDTTAETVRSLANYGSSSRYHYAYNGYNNRIDEIQAAMLRVKLRHLDEISQRRQEAASAYLDAITHPSITLPSTAKEGERCVWHQFTIRTPRRDDLRKELEEKGIGTLVHYPVPPHRQPAMQGVVDGHYPVADSIAATVVSLPIADITPDQARLIAEAINSSKTITTEK